MEPIGLYERNFMTTEMQKNEMPAEIQHEISKALTDLHKNAKKDGIRMYEETPHYQGIDKGDPNCVYRRKETEEWKRYRLDVMKQAIAPIIIRAMKAKRPNFLKDSSFSEGLIKASVTVASGFTPYDLQAPAKSLVPWLTPLVESTPRVQRADPGAQAYWKSVINTASSLGRGGAPAMAWINEGQRAPSMTLQTSLQTAVYASLGVDISATFEAESASIGFEDVIAANHFYSLMNLRDKEEIALLAGNSSLALGTANTPTGAFILSSASSVSSYSSYASSGTYYAACVGLTQEGWYNNQLAYGTSPSSIQQQQAITTPDSKVMTINFGCGQLSTVSSLSSGSSGVFGWTVTPKNGEVAYAWYLGTTGSSLSSLYFAGITTAPYFAYSASSAPATTTQSASSLVATDFSYNNGSQGGGTNQVKAFDGYLTQAWNNNNLTPQNAYTINLNNAALTTTGKGNVVEIDNMLISMWNNYKVTVDEIFVNAQEMANITSRVLNGSSAPLLRYVEGESNYDLVASGVISFYFNPYVPGGRKIPIMIHPKIAPGTILARGRSLPEYFKANSTANIFEVLTRRDYYTIDWPLTTREYQSGIYLEEVLAGYVPFAIGVISGIKNA
jgi:hypothetical protein